MSLTNPKTIKTWRERCDELHSPMAVVSSSMIQQRMQEEIDELRAALKSAHEPGGEPTDFRHLYECEKASKAVLQCETDSLKADLHAMTNAPETLEALKTAHQALLEVAHAQDVGPEWYTRGASGLRQQVGMWVRRGLDALNKARPTENGGDKP